jgi:hypothetical protein
MQSKEEMKRVLFSYSSCFLFLSTIFSLGIFEVDQETGIVRAAQAFEKEGEVNLLIEVNDVGALAADNEHSDNTSVLIQILPGNFKKPEFLFPNKINSTLIALEVSTCFKISIYIRLIV